MTSGFGRSELTLKSLKIIKTERTSSLDDCKSPPKMQVMPPTPMNSLYLQSCGLAYGASTHRVRMATGIVCHQKDNRILGKRTMAIVMEMVKTRLAP
jgi:hypothetical protein